MRRRRRFSAEFKEVALEAIKGHETVCGAGDQARTASDPDCSLEARGDREAGQGVRKVNMTISLAFLAPDLVKAAIEGRLPRGIWSGPSLRCAGVIPENHIRAYLWCKPHKMGVATMVPDRSTARPSGASLLSPRCVRVPL
jgi:hypothetical protein